MNGIPYIPECEDIAGGSRLLLDFSTSTVEAFEERYIEFFGVTARIVLERHHFLGFFRDADSGSMSFKVRISVCDFNQIHIFFVSEKINLCMEM